MGIITFNGVSSDTYGIRVEKCPDYNAAERKVEFISVEGRNGDLVRDTGAYTNVTQNYDVYFGDEYDSFQRMSSAVSMWLLGSRGYCRLEDDYFPEVYRMAVYNGMIQNRNFMNKKGRATLQFNCKPQRFLKTGEAWQNIPFGGSTFTNYFMPCYPLVEVTGNGLVSYGSTVITVQGNANSTLVFDTELQDAYTGDLSHEPFNTPYHVTIFMGGASPFSQKVMLPTNWSDYSVIHVQYVTFNPSVDGILDIDTSVNFSQTVGDWTVSHNASDGFITFALDGSQFVPPSGRQFTISGSITSLINRNNDIMISGDVEPFKTGSTSIYHSASSVRIMPRTWTL